MRKQYETINVYLGSGERARRRREILLSIAVANNLCHGDAPSFSKAVALLIDRAIREADEYDGYEND